MKTRLFTTLLFFLLITSGIMASDPHENRLNELIEHFDKQGRNIRPLLPEPQYSLPE